MRHFVPSEIQISDFYCFSTIYRTYDISSMYRLTSVKEKRNITIHRQNKMCSVTKVA